MTVCPVALAVGCKRCPVFAVCPAKSILGDQPAKPEAAAAAQPKAASKPAARKRKR